MVLFRHNRLLNNRHLILLSSKSRNENRNTFHVKFMSDDAAKSVNIRLSNGTSMVLSTGKYARFTSGSVVAELGNTSVMTTVVRKKEPSVNSIVPLTVNYRQKAAAIGRIPTNFLRRELGTTENEILISRVIDRSLRPLFPSEYSYETQIVCNLVATDGNINSDVLSINAASAALSISDIPWHGPVAAVRVGLIDGTFVINPSKYELRKSSLNIIVASLLKNLIVMLEGSANDIQEPDLRKAIKLGAKECQTIIESIVQLQAKIGKAKFVAVEENERNYKLETFVKSFAEKKLHKIFSCHSHDKISRDDAVNDLRKQMFQILKGDDPKMIENIEKIFHNISKKVFRSVIMGTGIRCDGRALNELRPIRCQVNMFDPLHGSAFFQRGQTQVLCTVTLDSIESSLKLDAITMAASGEKEKHFFLHYEFPPYAVNETGKVSNIDRREIGHGALAEKGLRAVIPKDYPFAIRLTSEVLESNGSSSMASICGGSLALMDAGVPISSLVAGVAMGLMVNSNQNSEEYKILTDISGIEDHFGDMDFKISGTKEGFTAFQADLKIPGIPLKVVMDCIHKASVAKNRILNIMNQALTSSKSSKKENKPVLDTIRVPVHQRAKFLGVGGMNLKKIFYETGVNLYSEDDETFTIFAPNQDAMNEAREMINELLEKQKEPTLNFGDIYTAKITEICENGVMIVLYPNMVPTLLPNSQLDQRKIHHASVLGFNVGDEIKVKYFGRDPVNGKIRLSRKVLQEPISSINDFITPKETLDACKRTTPKSTINPETTNNKQQTTKSDFAS